MAISKMISQLKQQINDLNKQGAKLAVQSKAKYDEASALSKILDQMEGLPEYVKKGTREIILKDGIHPKTRLARLKLLDILRKHKSRIRAYDLVQKYGLGYSTQFSLIQRFPETFGTVADKEEKCDVMLLLKDPDEKPPEGANAG